MDLGVVCFIFTSIIPSPIPMYNLRNLFSCACPSTEIKSSNFKCKPGWTGKLCYQECPNKLLPGEYYSGSTGSRSCQVSQCTNAKTGEYYTGSGLDGQTFCPTAPCTTKLKAGLRFITNGGTSSTGCKIGGVYAFSTEFDTLTIHICMYVTNLQT